MRFRVNERIFIVKILGKYDDKVIRLCDSEESLYNTLMEVEDCECSKCSIRKVSRRSCLIIE